MLQQPMGLKRPRKLYTPEQKFQILQEIDKMPSIQEGLERFQIASSSYYKWKRQLQVGVNACLRNSKPVKPFELRQLEAQNKKLMEMVLNLSHENCELKKTFILPR